MARKTEGEPQPTGDHRNPLGPLAEQLYRPEERSREALDALWKRVHAEARKPQDKKTSS